MPLTLNAALEKTKTKAIITRDEEINRFIVRIADQQSGEVVREIPNEAILKFARNLQAKGLILTSHCSSLLLQPLPKNDCSLN